MIDLNVLLDDFDKLTPEELRARHLDLCEVVMQLTWVLESPGWLHLTKLLADNATVVEAERTGAWFSSVEAICKDQYMKGSAHGLRRAISLLPDSLESYRRARDTVGTALELMERHDGSGTSGSPGGDFAGDHDIHSGDAARYAP